jgi:acyl-CoA synthetase (AMP-forming)/AMP-acid ligase II
VDADGWCTVGDLARTVPGGFEVLGRGATAVTTGGHTVVVEEVERVLLGVPGVTDVGVVGLPHQRLGAALVAVVVGDVDDETLRAAVRGLPVPSRPLRHLRAAAVPRTGGGKLRRQELIALAGRLAAQ